MTICSKPLIELDELAWIERQIGSCLIDQPLCTKRRLLGKFQATLSCDERIGPTRHHPNMQRDNGRFPIIRTGHQFAQFLPCGENEFEISYVLFGDPVAIGSERHRLPKSYRWTFADVLRRHFSQAARLSETDRRIDEFGVLNGRTAQH